MTPTPPLKLTESVVFEPRVIDDGVAPNDVMTIGVTISDDADVAL
jgi:hypothetical protein